MKSSLLHTGLFLLGSSLLVVAACDWDSVDPRVGAGGDAAVGGGGVGGGGAVGGGAEGGGGVGGAGGQTALECGAVDLAADDFEDGERDPDKWRQTNNYGGTNEEVGGQLVMGVGADASAFGYYETWGFMNLVGRSVAVEVPQVFSMTPGAIMDFEAAMSGGNKLILRYVASDATFEGIKVVDGVGAKLFDIPYDATNHRWWRFRVTEDTAIWEASADNSDYTKLAEEPFTSLFVPDHVRVRLEYENDTEMIGDQILWDNVVVEGPGTGTWCGIETFTESFSDPLTRSWLASGVDTGATAKITEGALYLTPNDAEDNDAIHRTSRLFDVTGQAVTVEMVEALNAPSTTFFRITSSTEWVDLAVQGDPDEMGDPTDPVLVARYSNEAMGVTTLSTVPYDPTQHRFLRIRDDDGTLIWESSPDGADWNVEASQAPLPVDLSVMRLELAAIGSPDTPVQGQAIFDNVNLLPE